MPHNVLVEGQQLVTADARQLTGNLVDQGMMKAMDIVFVQAFLAVLIELKALLEGFQQWPGLAIDRTIAISTIEPEQTEQPLVEHQRLREIG